jgi:hypothetical protein
MTDYRKPVPKSQKEISNSLQNPYDPTVGNPNKDTEFSQFPNTNQAGIPFNRSEQMSLKGDTYKPFTVGLEDIDEALMFYFQNVIRPYVIQNGQRIEVPIIYGSPEKWKSVQKDGYYKDNRGATMLPLIMFKRNSVTKNRSLANKLDANMPHLYTSWQAQYNPKNFYSNFAALNNRVPTKQFIANVVPDYVTLQYTVMIQTYYIDQLNKIVEACNYASDSYWGNPERYQFKASIDSFQTINELTKTEERSVRSTFDLNMYGYIIPDIVQKDLNSIKKYNEKSKVIFSLETTQLAPTGQTTFLDPQIFMSNPEVTPDGRNRLPIDVNTRKINQADTEI